MDWSSKFKFGATQVLEENMGKLLYNLQISLEVRQQENSLTKIQNPEPKQEMVNK